MEGVSDGHSESDPVDDIAPSPRSFDRPGRHSFGSLDDSYHEKMDVDDERVHNIRETSIDQYFTNKDAPAPRNPKPRLSITSRKNSNNTWTIPPNGKQITPETTDPIHTYYMAFLKTMILEGLDFYTAIPSLGNAFDFRLEEQYMDVQEAKIKLEPEMSRASLAEPYQSSLPTYDDMEVKEESESAALHRLPEYKPQVESHTSPSPSSSNQYEADIAETRKAIQNTAEILEKTRQAGSDPQNQLFHVLSDDKSSRLVLFLARTQSFVEILPEELEYQEIEILNPSYTPLIQERKQYSRDLIQRRISGKLGSASLINQIDSLLFAPAPSTVCKQSPPHFFSNVTQFWKRRSYLNSSNGAKQC